MCASICIHDNLVHPLINYQFNLPSIQILTYCLCYCSVQRWLWHAVFCLTYINNYACHSRSLSLSLRRVVRNWRTRLVKEEVTRGKALPLGGGQQRITFNFSKWISAASWNMNRGEIKDTFVTSVQLWPICVINSQGPNIEHLKDAQFKIQCAIL